MMLKKFNCLLVESEALVGILSTSDGGPPRRSS